MAIQDSLPQRLERLERLRMLGLRRGAREVAPPVPQPVDGASLPGAVCDTPFGPAWVHTIRYPLGERPDLAGLLDVRPEALAALGGDPDGGALNPAGAAFLDTETTGLSLGAGTYTFLIGIGSYEPDSDMHSDTLVDAGALAGAGGHRLARSEGQERGTGSFVVRQFFMRNPAEERAQLHLVEDALLRCEGLVTFNGRAFDLPLVQNRFVMAQMPWPGVGLPHLDLLPAARRVWRARHGSCSLGNLEQKVLALLRPPEDDVPGWMIPDIYRDFIRTGTNTDMLERVFYHNQQDIVSMALLGARLGRLFHYPDGHRLARLPAEISLLHPLELLSLARCYEALSWVDAGLLAYQSALDRDLDPTDQAEGLRSLGFLYKRLGRWREAAALWEEWIGTVPGYDVTPYIELAKYHEWRTGDLHAARGWAAWALRIAHQGAAEAPTPRSGASRIPRTGAVSGIAGRAARGYATVERGADLVSDLQHRLARLEGKLLSGRSEG